MLANIGFLVVLGSLQLVNMPMAVSIAASKVSMQQMQGFLRVSAKIVVKRRLGSGANGDGLRSFRELAEFWVASAVELGFIAVARQNLESGLQEPGECRASPWGPVDTSVLSNWTWVWSHGSLALSVGDWAWVAVCGTRHFPSTMEASCPEEC